MRELDVWGLRIEGAVTAAIAATVLTAAILGGCSVEAHHPDGGALPGSFDPARVRTNGTIVSSGPNLEVDFSGDKSDVYEVRYRPVQSTTFDGEIEFTLRTEGWEEIRYLAYGWMDHGDYWHVKNMHPPEGALFTEAVGPHSVTFGLTQEWTRPHDIQLDEFRVLVSGRPQPAGARIEIHQLALLDRTTGDTGDDFDVQPSSGPVVAYSDVDFAAIEVRQSITAQQELLLTALHSYQAADFSTFAETAQRFVTDREVLLRGMPPMSWPLDAPEPLGVQDYTTTRFLWQALNLVEALMLAYEASGTIEYLDHALALADSWMGKNLNRAPEDPKYTWYDHGTGLRAIELARLWRLAPAGADPDLLRHLLLAVFRHGEALAADSFYSRDQLTRDHNHALFQDLGLFVVGMLAPEVNRAPAWRDTARRRIVERFEALASPSGVWLENSLGYHLAAEQLCRTFGEILAIDGGDPLASICDRMAEFSEAVSYPNGGGCSFGDSYRRSNGTSGSLPAPFTCTRSVHDYSSDGYVAIDECDAAGVPMKLVVVAPSSTSTHKHADNLSFCLWADGVEWLIDPGFHTHDYDESLNAYARGPWGHSALVLPDEPYSKDPGITSLALDTTDGYAVVGSHRGYGSSTVRRSFVGAVGHLAWTVIDSVDRASIPSIASLKLVFQVGDAVSIELGRGGFLLTSVASSKRVVVTFDRPLRCEALSAVFDDTTIGGWTFPGFAQAEPSTTVVCDIGWRRRIEWTVEIQ